ncbi:SOS response-associated peptidase family protein [Aneurinibacillus migulanus]|uniref:SOS response-associated peptidase family protein n=1 Tax=Aneurinibacillus migulanus TaxID=47500 RepID=UPI00399CFDA3
MLLGGWRWGNASITSELNDMTREVHNRMPVILHAKDEKVWLDSSVNDVELIAPLNSL